MSKPAVASLRYLLPNVSFTDSLWHMALTAQPRAKLVNAITSFPTMAKGTEEKKNRQRGSLAQSSKTFRHWLNWNKWWKRRVFGAVLCIIPGMHAKELVSRDVPALSSIPADLSQGERCCLCSNTIRDILPRGTIVRRWLNAIQMEEGGIHTAFAVLEECRGGWAPKC